MVASVTRAAVLGFRVRAQQLDRDSGTLVDTAVLDLGVQDTGPDGGRWALALRGAVGVAEPELVMAWTIRGAPHLYRRADISGVAAAVAPFSDADAGKRIFDAARPLKAAGIGNLAALDAVASAMRSVVVEPMVKGAVSRRVTALMDEPYLRFCRPCGASHLYEQPFRLAALRAGLVLELWPVLGRPGAVLADGEIAGTWRPRKAGARLDVTVRLWSPVDRAAVEEQAEQLAAHRGVRLGSVAVDG